MREAIKRNQPRPDGVPDDGGNQTQSVLESVPDNGGNQTQPVLESVPDDGGNQTQSVLESVYLRMPSVPVARS